MLNKVEINIETKGDKDFDILCRSVYRFASRIFADELISVTVKLLQEEEK